MKKFELVLPGGDYKRAKIALDFGADAVYVGLNKYSLRKGEVRFNISEIKKTIKYAHYFNKKVYVTFNIFAHNKHLSGIENDMKKIAKLKPDAFIIANVGVMQIARRVAKNIPVHVSTQANTTNIEDVKFWKKQGVKRVVLARELTLKEITEIKKAISGIELEVFAHGSMCISYSGRCLLSNYMTGRHSNLGDCTQPCRWNYDVYLKEKKRPSELFKIEESQDGVNIMSSKDLCTIKYIDKMVRAGINGFKVEGRNKTEYYLASAALAYREALDLIKKNKFNNKAKTRLSNDLEKVANRGYTEGFLFDNAKKGETYEGRSPIKKWSYIGKITKKIKTNNINQYETIIKNKISVNDNVEILIPNGIYKDKILKITVDKKTKKTISPGKINQQALITLRDVYPNKNALIRKRISNS